MKKIIIIFMLILAASISLSAQSITVLSEKSEAELDLDYAHVMKVKATANEGFWRFDVTLRHGDTGWDHYADLWIVSDAETGEEYGRRILTHPHIDEQPFTRSLSGIKIPEEVTAVIVKAACTVHGFGGNELELRIDNIE